MKKLGLVSVFILLFCAQSSFAFSERMDKKFGFHVGVIGEPFPSIIGVNLNYNIFDFLRVSAGYGSISTTQSGAELSATTIGAGLKTFIPGWSFSPMVGLSWANVSMTVTGNASGLDVGGFTAGRDGSHIYATFGIDWQTGLGLNLGAGYAYSFLDGVGGLPFVYIGWYF